MKKIILIRHAESEGNIGGYFEHSHLINLSAEGKKQAAELSEIVEKPNRIIVSKFIRTVETAEPMMRRFPDSETHLWIDLHEFEPHDVKKSFGLSIEERENFYSNYWRKQDPFLKETDDSETFAELVDRILVLVKKFKKIDSGLNYIITHGIIIKMFLFLKDNSKKFLEVDKDKGMYKNIMIDFIEFNKAFETQHIGMYDITDICEKF